MLRGKYQHALYHMLSVARNETENKSVLSIPRCYIILYNVFSDFVIL